MTQHNGKECGKETALSRRAQVTLLVNASLILNMTTLLDNDSMLRRLIVCIFLDLYLAKELGINSVNQEFLLKYKNLR